MKNDVIIYSNDERYSHIGWICLSDDQDIHVMDIFYDFEESLKTDKREVYKIGKQQPFKGSINVDDNRYTIYDSIDELDQKDREILEALFKRVTPEGFVSSLSSSLKQINPCLMKSTTRFYHHDCETRNNTFYDMKLITQNDTYLSAVADIVNTYDSFRRSFSELCTA